MKTDQQKQAENLFFQTNLTKTEIAEAVGVSRRTIHYWVQQNHWDAIRQASSAMPTILAGNCYLILSRLQNSILSRQDEPVTMQEVNAIYKLTTTIQKLNTKGALAENLEALTHFMEFTNNFDPQLANDLQPVMSAFASHSAAAQQHPGFTPPPSRETPEERQLDLEDFAAWAAEKLNTPAQPPIDKVAPAPRPHSSTPAAPPPHTRSATPTNRAPQAHSETPAAPAPHSHSSTPAAPAPRSHSAPSHLNRAARRAMARAAA